MAKDEVLQWALRQTVTQLTHSGILQLQMQLRKDSEPGALATNAWRLLSSHNSRRSKATMELIWGGTRVLHLAKEHFSLAREHELQDTLCQPRDEWQQAITIGTQKHTRYSQNKKLRVPIPTELPNKLPIPDNMR
eukprot:1877107-Amphidinium_carterae.1